MNKNLYDALGVASTATHAEIRKAYRKAAVQYHPDRNPSSEAQEVFRQITEAYEVLNDPTRRDLYDRYGDIALNPHFKGFEQDTHSQFGDFSSFSLDLAAVMVRNPIRGQKGILVKVVLSPLHKILIEAGKMSRTKHFLLGQAVAQEPVGPRYGLCSTTTRW